RGYHRLPRPAALSRHADRQPALWRAQGRRAWPRAMRRTKAAAAGRALLRPQRRGDRGHGILDRGHQEGPRHHRDHGRARHEAGQRRARSRHGAELWPRDRARHTTRGADSSRGGARLYRRRSMTAAADPILRVSNIETFYGPIQAIRSVSLEVPRGRIVTVLGANGAGKTTILR